MKRVSLVAVVLNVLMGLAAHAAPGPWEQPAAALSEEIASILGPGQAHLTIRNLSTIPIDQVPTIRHLLEQDLKTHGVLASGAESANSIRVTLSENVRERLWVAEIVEGNETRVAMVHVEPPIERTSTAAESIVLRKERLPLMLNSHPGVPEEPVLAAIDTNSGMILLRPEEIGIFAHGEVSWNQVQSQEMKQAQSIPRDPRGLLLRSDDGKSFTAHAPGTECTGVSMPPQSTGAHPGDAWAIQCHPSDDPWPILIADTPSGAATIKAFYNAARNYFTGVVTPSLGVDLPPFYSAALLPRPAGSALLIGGIDGKVLLVESGSLKAGVSMDRSSSEGLKPVSGARDWGSDFEVLHSGCGSGTQIIASGSGEALSDSLRAYELPAQEAIPASAPLSMNGTLTALIASSDDKSVLAVVRKTAGPGSADQYEVDRVTASCN
jgi:hypothetical protein